MSRILCFSDLHLGAGYEHRRDALADAEGVLTQIADLAVERGVELCLNGGDTFHRAKPDPPALHVFKRFCARLEAAEIPLVALGGNGLHEAAPGQRSALELFASRYVEVSRTPELVPLAGVTVCTLPAATVGRLAAAQSSGDRAELNAQAVELLLRAARDLFASADPSKPRVLLAHQMVSGASLPTGLPVEQVGACVLPLEELEAIGYDAIVLGDLHKAQILGETGRVVYCGSPMCQDFGEQDEQHGCYVLHFGDSVFGDARPEFVPLADRPFATIDCDLTDEVEAYHLGAAGETDAIASSIAAALPLIDAVVRVRYRATDEQHRRVDQAALLRLLENAGAHRVYGGIAWQAVREQRTRAADLTEQLGPLDAVGLWLAAQSMNGAEGEALRALTAAYLEGLA